MSLIRKFLFKNKKHINGLIHVGANVGQEVPMYFEITNSNIYLFEPLDSAFEILKDKYGNLQNVKLYNFGLGNKNQEINTLTSEVLDKLSTTLELSAFWPIYMVLIKGDVDQKVKNVESL